MRDELRIDSLADPLDQVRLSAEREIAVQRLDNAAKRIQDVRAALAKIEEGTYGICEQCEEPIPRMQAKGETVMPEVAVAKQPKHETTEAGFPRLEMPPFGGGFFSVNPFALMRQFTEDMGRMFGPMPGARAGETAWTPAIEVKAKEGKLQLTAELPGLTKDDVKVHIDGDRLIVEGERKQEKEEKREGYYHSERSYGKFYRSVQLPEGAKIDQTAATFHDGVLEVTIPIPETQAKRKDIPVQASK